MKIKTIICCIILQFGYLMSKAQDIRYKCDYRTYCEENVFTEQLGNCEGYEEESRFVLNEDGSEIIHYTPELTSIYTIHHKRYYPRTGTLSLKVVSDAGNEYEYVIDERNRKIKAYFLNQDSKGLVAIFSISEIGY